MRLGSLLLAAILLSVPARLGHAGDLITDQELIQAPNVGRCLDVPNADFRPGARVIMYPCQSSPNQIFTFQGGLKGWTITINGLCVDAFRPGGGVSQSGDAVGLWTCQGSSNQIWRQNAQYSLSGQFMYINGNSPAGRDLCLYVDGPLNGQWPGLVLAPCNAANPNFRFSRKAPRMGAR